MSFVGSPKRVLEALAGYDFTGQDEQAIREQWIYPLLTLLGYGLGTPNPVDIPFKVDLASPDSCAGIAMRGDRLPPDSARGRALDHRGEA
jgi:hypothetical protein